MKIGIMGAMLEEVAQIERLMDVSHRSTIAGRSFIEGRIGHHEVVLTFSKWGKVAAAMTSTLLIEHFTIASLIFSGVAGAINPALNIGDVVIATGAYQHDMDARPLFNKFQIPLSDTIVFETNEQDVQRALFATKTTLANIHHYISDDALTKFSIKAPAVCCGLIATGDKFVASKKEHQEIFLNFNGNETQAVEMEGGAVLHVCKEFEVPCTLIRTISDKADHSAEIDFPAFIQDVASHYSEHIICKLLTTFPD